MQSRFLQGRAAARDTHQGQPQVKRARRACLGDVSSSSDPHSPRTGLPAHFHIHPGCWEGRKEPLGHTADCGIVAPPLALSAVRIADMVQPTCLA